MNIEVWFKNRVLAYPGAQAHGTHAICHAELSMFGCVKCGTINASQLFFQGSHVLSIFNLRIHACNKNKITTFYRWQWKYLTALLSKFVPYGHRSFKGKCGIKLKIIKKQIQWTLWDHVIPSACYSFHLISFTRFSRGQSHHKSGSLNNKYEYHSTTQSTAENHLPMYEPLPSSRQSHSQNDPKTLPGPRPSLLATSTVAFAEISCSTTAAWPFWAAQCSPVRPRCRGCEADGGAAAAAVDKQGIAMGCFSGLLGKYFWIGHRQKICHPILLVWGIGEKQEQIIANQSCYMCLLEILQAVAAYFRNIMCGLYSVSCQVQWNQDRPLYPHGDMPEWNVTNPEHPITIVHSSGEKLV